MADKAKMLSKLPEAELKTAVKDILLKRPDKSLKPCNEYPTAKQLKQKFKLEKESR